MPPPFLFLLLLCSNGFFFSAVLSAQPQSLRFELLRTPPPPHTATAARLDYFGGLVRNDFLRRQMISSRITHRRRHRHHRRRASETHSSPPLSESFAMPLSAGAYTGSGLYFVRLQLGTPAQKFLLAADTGSDLTWVKCLPPGRRAGASGGGGGVVGRVFRPEDSRTYKSIECSSELCKDTLAFSLTTCPTPTSPCEYYYSYSDGSAAEGDYAYESATILLQGRHRAKLRGLVVGCTSSYDGAEFNVTDGVLGLSYSETSFAARATARFGGRFSYCLVDHLSPRNASSYLTFGPNPSLSDHPPTAPRTKATDLILDSRLDSFYTISIRSISVDGERLASIPAAVWDVASGGGTILDSGTSAMVLVDPAYQAVTAALSRRLAGVPRMNESDAPFEYCYKWSERKSPAVLPKLVFHLARGARFAPPAKSYLIDVADGVKCIGITSAPWPGANTIGNIVQQEHIWEFDIKNRRLRFRASTCPAKN